MNKCKHLYYNSCSSCLNHSSNNSSYKRCCSSNRCKRVMWHLILAHSLVEEGCRHQILEVDKDWMRQDQTKHKDIEICREVKPFSNNLVRISNISKQVNRRFTSSTRCRCRLLQETLRINIFGCCWLLAYSTLACRSLEAWKASKPRSSRSSKRRCKAHSKQRAAASASTRMTAQPAAMMTLIPFRHLWKAWARKQQLMAEQKQNKPKQIQSIMQMWNSIAVKVWTTSIRTWINNSSQSWSKRSWSQLRTPTSSEKKMMIQVTLGDNQVSYPQDQHTRREWQTILWTTPKLWARASTRSSEFVWQEDHALVRQLLWQLSTESWHRWDSKFCRCQKLPPCWWKEELWYRRRNWHSQMPSGFR